jgi:dihydroorotate dehydrogenase
MYAWIRPLLFHISPERAHHLTLSVLEHLPSSWFKKPAHHPVQALGLEFAHPIGLAAGLDKNAEYLSALAKLGFSFIEVGTVTPKPQVGNPKPRLFRLPQAHALINRMGFNNLGVDVLVDNVRKAEYSGILGINIGKNKETSLQQAADDYLHCLRKVYAFASYVTINISSPNTPDLRQLQQEEYLRDLLAQLRGEQLHLADAHKRHVPLMIKLSPDENADELKKMAAVIVASGVEGIIATNTTCARDGVQNLPHAHEMGGLSGSPLLDKATQCLRIIKQTVGDEIVLVGVGGIHSPESAVDKLQAGASLLQVYTGLIYQGPQLINDVTEGLQGSAYTPL